MPCVTAPPGKRRSGVACLSGPNTPSGVAWIPVQHVGIDEGMTVEWRTVTACK